jgi:hypothetical protein
MATSQLSQLAAIARVVVDQGNNFAFAVQRGFRKVEAVATLPGPLPGFCRLSFDQSGGTPTPTECVVVVSPESQVLPPSANAAVDWQWDFFGGEWTLLVVTSDCNGAAQRTFNVVVHRVN